MIRTAPRRVAAAALTAAALTALPLLGTAAPARAAAQDIVSAPAAEKDGYRQQILDEVNRHRKANGLRPVRYSPTITGIAQDESDRVVRAERVSHSMDFLSDPRRGTGVDAMNEITALEHSIDPAALVRWWKSSPSHDKVLLSPEIEVIGIGVTIADGRLTNTGQPWRLVSVVDGYGYVPGHGPADARAGVTGSAPAVSPQSVAAPMTRPAPLTTAAAGPFRDVPGSHPFAAEIGWARDRGLLTGWADGTFRPSQSIDRDAMAAVAYRMAGSPAYRPPAVSPYRDVPTGHQFYKEITWARSEGLLTGWSDGTFRPGDDMARDATAALLWRMEGRPAAGPAPFADVRPGQLHGEAIAWMADEGIARGWADGTFRPRASTERGAMAAFLQRSAR
ncbi:S-layer homology domain-containing protein [Kocuria palustris]|uniref:CAP and S-layer homology domain-containing protein n=1 Tax=Kocuria palustris TaxID=71999 RepID=UPI0016426ECF|nr:S-layer homology domain-containing protein [Kocuria palustris]